MKPTRPSNRERLDWGAIKDRIDMAAVATDLLGPSVKRSGRRLLWHCPFHDDRNPSFEVDPATHRWKCWPCDKGGDAPALVMAMEGLSFPEAVREVAELHGIIGPSGKPVKAAWPTRREPVAPKPKPKPRPDESPSGLAPPEALALVEESRERLWTPAGRPAREYLVVARGLTEATIRRHGLGWTPEVWLPTKDGIRYFRAAGIVIPGFDGDRLRLVKIRQADGAKPRYAEAFRDRPMVYPGRWALRPGRPLIAVEGEFDAMLLGQELDGLAGVVTFGGSSAPPDLETQLIAGRCPVRFAAHDADPSGDRAAAAWSAEAERVRPPAGKDWTDARNAGIDLRRWWIENHLPEAFDAEERAAIE